MFDMGPSVRSQCRKRQSRLYASAVDALPSTHVIRFAAKDSLQEARRSKKSFKSTNWTGVSPRPDWTVVWTSRPEGFDRGLGGILWCGLVGGQTTSRLEAIAISWFSCFGTTAVSHATSDCLHVGFSSYTLHLQVPASSEGMTGPSKPTPKP